MKTPFPVRKQLRLPEYDYSSAGFYCETLVTHSRLSLFGSIAGDRIALNPAGSAVEAMLQSVPNRFPQVGIDEYCIMPNHLHAILIIQEQDQAGPEHEEMNAGSGAGKISLPGVMGWFKSMTTHVYMDGVQRQGWPRFDGKLWQRSYYEHIIRDENDLTRMREYIVNNPLQWSIDEENPIDS